MYMGTLGAMLNLKSRRTFKSQLENHYEDCPYIRARHKHATQEEDSSRGLKVYRDYHSEAHHHDCGNGDQDCLRSCRTCQESGSHPKARKRKINDEEAGARPDVPAAKKSKPTPTDTVVSPPKRAPSTKQTARKRPSKPSSKDSAASAKMSPSPSARPKQTARKSVSRAEKDEDIKLEKVKEEPQPKVEPKSEAENEPDAYSESDDLQQQAGNYDITCEEVAGEWPDFVPERGQRLRLQYSKSENAYWGSYNLGMFYGRFHSPAPELRDGGDGVYIRLKWRGQDASEDIMSFDADNTGYIRISNRGIKGGFNNMYGDLVEFSGRRMMDPSIAGGTVEEHKAAYNSINQANYDHANRARWGRGGW